MSHCYAGIGSRETPPDVLALIAKLGTFLADQGATLRSGGAIGADRAFEAGVNLSKNPNLKEIFKAEDATPAAAEYTSKFHPNWSACNEYARKLHGRNAMIILGANLSLPVGFVICYTKDGKDTGGTGQALRISQANGIMVYNLQKPQTREYFEALF